MPYKITLMKTLTLLTLLIYIKQFLITHSLSYGRLVHVSDIQKM